MHTSASRQKDPQGQQANKTGKRFELDIEGRLLSHGYERCKPTMPSEALASMQTPYFIPQCRNVFRNIYGRPMCVDFYVWHPEKHPRGLIIETKWQQVTGTVDQKYPYLIYSLLKIGRPSLVLLMGDGAGLAAVAWVKEQAREHADLLTVFTRWEDLITLCNKGYL